MRKILRNALAICFICVSSLLVSCGDGGVPSTSIKLSDYLANEGGPNDCRVMYVIDCGDEWPGVPSKSSDAAAYVINGDTVCEKHPTDASTGYWDYLDLSMIADVTDDDVINWESGFDDHPNMEMYLEKPQFVLDDNGRVANEFLNFTLYQRGKAKANAPGGYAKWESYLLIEPVDNIRINQSVFYGFLACSFNSSSFNSEYYILFRSDGTHKEMVFDEFSDDGIEKIDGEAITHDDCTRKKESEDEEKQFIEKERYLWGLWRGSLPFGNV